MDLSFNGILNEAKDRMQRAVSGPEQDLKGIRTGRVTPSLVDQIRIEDSGSMTRISQISVQDGKLFRLPLPMLTEDQRKKESPTRRRWSKPSASPSETSVATRTSRPSGL